MTGLAYASGDLIFLIDSDLQEPPEALAAFYERLALGDCDVVYGFQARRSGGLFERITGSLYYSLLDMLTDRMELVMPPKIELGHVFGMAPLSPKHSLCPNTPPRDRRCGSSRRTTTLARTALT